MAARLTRRSIAEYVAQRIADGADIAPLVQQVAAYLVETRRTREADLVVYSIYESLEERDIVVATVETARPLTEAMRVSVEEMLAASTTHLREVVDATHLGGVKVVTPSKTLDGTLAHKINALRAAKQV